MSDLQSKRYDVAISLRWTDVEHARALYDVLRDRLEVFFADDRQEDFVGTDGEETFGHIFRDRARIVVVLYRPDWGSTPFTRAEEAAIKQRAWNGGYGFSIWVPMDEAKSVPPYLPPQHVWFDFARYGVSGLASVVEERVRESGREVRPETALDRIQAVKRRIDLQHQRSTFLSSQAGVDYVAESFAQTESLIDKKIEEYNAVSPYVQFVQNVERGQRSVTAWPFRCFFYEERYASNSASRAQIEVHIYKNIARRTHDTPWSEVAKMTFKPTLDPEGVPSWLGKGGVYHNMESAISEVLDFLAERAYQAHEKGLSG
jgi:hypothetical protein